MVILPEPVTSNAANNSNRLPLTTPVAMLKFSAVGCAERSEAHRIVLNRLNQTTPKQNNEPNQFVIPIFFRNLYNIQLRTG